MKEPQPNETYKHYKGNDYRIIALGKHTETGEEMVVYQALYGKGQIWVRSKEIFLSEASINGEMQPRFRLTEDISA